MRKKVSLVTPSALTLSVPRSELCSYLRAAISEQRRIDATYASHEGSISSSQAAALSIEARPDKEADVRLVLPPEPQPGKGGKIKSGQRKHRHTTKAGLPSQIAISTDQAVRIPRQDYCIPSISSIQVTSHCCGSTLVDIGPPRPQSRVDHR